MKFGALLRSSAREVPELQSLFECYKQLKKRLKRLPAREAPAAAALATNESVRAHQRAFVSLLISDIQAFNETFVEREEQSVIQLSLIEARATAAREAEEVAAVYKSYVDFHGQTLMLVHWSILAYTSVLKILKKHHKRTGLQIQEFNLQQLLSQPFCSVELISGLVRKAEAKAQDLAGRLNPSAGQASLSVASPHSSPVAELISAARASVREIAESAAQGDAALDEHLRDQPTSSDDASAEGGEAEVLSGPHRHQNGAKSSEQHRSAGAAAVEPPQASATEAQSRPSTKRGLSPHPGAPDTKRGRHEDGAARGGGAAGATGVHLVRTESVAGDSELPVEGPNPKQGEGAPLRCEVCANGTGGSENRGRSSSGPAAAESDAGSGRSPQLTMGQGQAWGPSGGSGSGNILRQTQMALGLWEQLHCTASTPSTVVPPLQHRSKSTRGSANSAV